MLDQIQSLGLIAGNGKFPILFAQAAKAKNIKVVAAGVKGDTSFALRFLVDQFRLFHVGELKNLLEYFSSLNIRHAVMVGQVNPNNLFDPSVTLDKDFEELKRAIQDHKADTIFAALAQKLKQYGIELLDSTFLLKDHLAPKGTLTQLAPSVIELQDIEFGILIAKMMGAIDIGQTVVVKEKAIVAIEAMEGTDRAILRGGRIAHSGAVVIKTSKPQQDDRFDVPVIGPGTIEAMKRSKARCLAIESGKTLIIDRDKTVQSANRAGITIVGV